MNHLVCNMFSQIQSGQKAQKRVLFQKKSKVCGKILDILWEEGYILGYRTSPFRRTTFEIFLKYSRGKPVVNRITAVSKPNFRISLSVEELWKLHTGLGLVILSTSKGMLSSIDGKKFNVGGEIFCIIK